MTSTTTVARASGLYKGISKQAIYFDQAFYRSAEEFKAAVEGSSTVYVGNLSFYTTDEQVFSLFRRCGDVRRVIMGLHKVNLTPCGFCFVEYFRPVDALTAVSSLNNLRLDDRLIRVDKDPGFREGRQYGRGKTGYQIRDEHRDTFDPARPASFVISPINQNAFESAINPSSKSPEPPPKRQKHEDE